MASDYRVFVEQNKQRYIEELTELLSIPSISTQSEHKDDVRRAAAWVADDLRRSGIENVRVIDTAGHPLVYGDWLHAAGAPTLLLYGHFDVQPPDPLDLWHTPPFEPTILDGRIVARGASDAKSPLWIAVPAVEAWLATEKRVPVN